MIPILNKTYSYFDDGKVNTTRLDKVNIIEIIAFGDIDDETLHIWENEVIDCHWLYNKKTDFFIKGKLEDVNEDIIFVRCVSNGWFSLGYWGGSLDIDGTILNGLVSNIESYLIEEQRCLDFCVSNPDECDDDEIIQREKEINKLNNKIEELKVYLDE